MPVQNWNARESSTTTEKNRSSVTEYTERYRGENENKSSSIMDEDRIIKSENTVVSIPAETSPTWIPTVTPTPTPVLRQQQLQYRYLQKSRKKRWKQ